MNFFRQRNRSSKRLPKKRRIQIDFDGEAGKIEYSPLRAAQKLGPLETRLASDDHETKRDAIIELLTGVLISWDALDADGDRVPIREDRMRQVCDEELEFLDVISTVYHEIGKDLQRVAASL